MRRERTDVALRTAWIGLLAAMVALATALANAAQEAFRPVDAPAPHVFVTIEAPDCAPTLQSRRAPMPSP